MTHRPRTERDAERMRAVAANRPAKDSAMDRALAQIEAAFGEAAAVNDFKLRVERLFQLGLRHPAARARFRARAEMLAGCNLTTATAKIERWWREERRAFQIRSAFGYGNRLSLEVLRELRLVLRLMRFKGMHAEFSTIIAALHGTLIAEAAE
jgi:hypothetical protein